MTEEAKHTPTPVAWQRRKACVEARQYMPGDWEACSRREAIDTFDRQPGYEYRPLYSDAELTTLRTKLAEAERALRAAKTQIAFWSDTFRLTPSPNLLPRIKPSDAVVEQIDSTLAFLSQAQDPS